MNVPERRRRLLAILARAERQCKPLTIAQMVREAESSITTVYLDLMYLENEGLAVHNSGAAGSGGKHGAAWRANLPMIVEQKKEVSP